MKLSDLLIYEDIIIQTHDNPDADAIASGFGLYNYFTENNKSVRLIYSGNLKIQKTNLLRMVRELDIPIEYVEPTENIGLMREKALLITTDCQYGAGNVTRFRAINVAIVDHHQEEIHDIPMSEIRSGYGSCSTVVWKLMKDEGFDFSDKKRLATALYYGLYSDTNQFGEIGTAVDMDMRDSLDFYPHIISTLRNSNISLKELETAGIALIRYIYNENYRYAIIKSQPCDPNILGLISDLVLQVDCVDTCIVFNEMEDGIKLSVRSCIREVKASELASYLTSGMGSGGGHIEKAGGYISKTMYERDYKALHAEAFFSERMNEYFGTTDIIYADETKLDLDSMSKYVKKKIHIGYVDIEELVPLGTPVLIRTVDGDLELINDGSFYVMIGIKGDAYPIKKSDFEKSYIRCEGDFELKAEYIPTIRNQLTGRQEVILPYAKTCVSSGLTHIHARELSRRVKIFTLWNSDKYMLGNPGDYLAARCDNPKDIYVVEKDIFVKTYERL